MAAPPAHREVIAGARGGQIVIADRYHDSTLAYREGAWGPTSWR